MSVEVIVGPEAAEQAEAIDDWWRANRPAARDLFASEFEAALRLLSGAPRSGQACEHPTITGVRRVLLRATRFHLYYRLSGGAVEVVAVWSCQRGSGPDLTALA